MTPTRSLAAAGATGALWWGHGLAWDGALAGAVGRLDAPGPEALAEWLAAAAPRLAAAGCTWALGPMDGATWQPYRLVTDAGTAPPFRLDVDTPPWWPGAFAAAGFAPVAHYVSTEAPLVPTAPAPVDGAVLRRVDAADLWAERERLHALVEAAFASNPAYVPMPAQAFFDQTAALAPLVVPGLALVAEAGGSTVGFVFAYPDADARTLVLKTLAVHPAWGGRGLGRWLADAVEANAWTLGMTRVVHALMHEHNGSRRMSAHRGAIVRRRYALYGRRLVAPPVL